MATKRRGHLGSAIGIGIVAVVAFGGCAGGGDADEDALFKDGGKGDGGTKKAGSIDWANGDSGTGTGGGSGSEGCPYTGPPKVDPSKFAECAPACGGAHCVPAAIVPPAQQAMLAECSVTGGGAGRSEERR